MAAPKWSTACVDWAERIVAGQSLVPFEPLFSKTADDALGVFKALQVTDLPRKPDGTWPTLGEVCEPFVFDLVGAIFGSEEPETGRRLIREALLLISKKNGKSMIAAGIMLTALIVGWRENAELLILAPTLEVAKNSFSPAMGMVRADPELATVLKVVEHQREIRNLASGSVLKVVAADSDTVSGNKAWAVLVEELWLFGKKPKSEAMLREALGGQSARSEAFTLFITTHSDEPPAGVFKTRLAYARDVRDGVIADPSFLPMLFEWPEQMIEDEAYLDPALFHVTNPHLGRSVSREWLEAELQKELSGEGEGLQVFLAKHLNVEIGLRLRRDRWGAADDWLEGADPTLTLQSLLARSEVVVAGVDGGGREDLFGVAVVGRERETGLWLVWAHAWCLESLLEKRKAIASLLRGFAADGDLTICGTGQEIVDSVAALIVQVRDSGKMPAESAVGFDMHDIGLLLDALVNAGLDPGDVGTGRTGQMVPVRQGVGLTSAIHSVEFKLGDAMLRHDGSELMAWCVSNCRAELRGSAVYIGKDTTGASKIDPVIAMLTAVKLMEQGPVAGTAGPGPTPWDIDPNFSLVAAA